MGSNLWQALKALDLFRLMENETMEIFSMCGRSKSKHKFHGVKVSEADEVREYFINPEVENNPLDYCANLVWISEKFLVS